MKFNFPPWCLFEHQPICKSTDRLQSFHANRPRSPRLHHRSSQRTRWPFKCTSVAAERSEVNRASKRDSSNLCRTGSSLWTGWPTDGRAADAQLMEGAEGRAAAIRPLTHVAPKHLCDCRPVSHTWLPVCCKQP